MELPKKFNNRENDHLMYRFISPGTDVKINQNFFISRSTAVVAIIFAMTKDGMKVLITKRSKSMVDEPGKFSLPCGYLDWDETRHEGMMREVYEETSFYMPDSEEYLVYNNDGQPIIVKDKPTDHRQNISNIYLNVYDFKDEPEIFPENIKYFTCKEVELVKWVDVGLFLINHDNLEWAFDHDETILNGLDHWNNLVYNKRF